VDVVCANCGAEHPPGAGFCSACGAPLRQSCRTCGAEQPAAAVFCSSCGAALREGAVRGEPTDDREERRVVTVLFADLAGSTALTERLDPEDVRAVQGELFALARAAVERHGGVTEKFVGDAVLAVFGIPQAHEDDAARGVRAALDLTAEFADFADRLRNRHGAEVGLRVGVNTGDVVTGRHAAARGELMVSGDAVNVAARLQQHAGTGEILVGERTHAATARTVEYAPRAAVEAKGKREPIPVWAAVGMRADRDRDGAIGAPLVGRDEEIAVLTALAARVEREQTPQLVTILGPAGVGKSRLLAELVGRLPQARLLRGRCLSYGDGITYFPLAEMAKGAAGILDTDPAPTALEKLTRSVEAVVPADDAGPVVQALAATIGLAAPNGGSSDERGRLHQAWSRYVAALGRERLTVMAVEDIHWASRPLLDLLDHLADSLEDTAVLMVCPSRPELLDSRRTWGAGKPNAASLSVSPLPPGEAGALVDALFGDPGVPERLRRLVLERSGGNPFFAEEIVRMLVEGGALEQRDGRWEPVGGAAAVPVPDSVHGVIAARLDLLQPSTREALRRCSVMGRVFWPSAVGVDEEAIAGLIRNVLVAERHGSVMAGLREFSFRHVLIQEVAYGSLPRPERRDLHLRVAGWLGEVAPDRLDENAELAAYHLTEAIALGADDDSVRSRAFAALERAAAAALFQGATSSAVSLYERARSLAADPGARGRALIGESRALIADTRYPLAAERLAEVQSIAAETGDARLRADALGWASRAYWLGGRWDEAFAAATAGVATLRGLGESPEYARALARRSQLAMLRDLPEAVEIARQALEVATRVGEPLAAVNARINLFSAESMRGKVPSYAEASEAADLALAAGAPDEAFRAVVNWAWTAHAYSALDELDPLLRDAQARLSGLVSPEAYGEYLLLSIGMLVDLPAGRWEALERLLAEPETPATRATNRLVWLALRTGMSLRRGDLASVDAYLPELRTGALESDEPQRIAPMLCVAMPRAALGGDNDEVRRLATIVLERDGRELTPTNPCVAIPRALAAAGELDLLRLLADSMRRVPEDRRQGELLLSFETSDALLQLADGRPNDAVDVLERVLERERARGRRYVAACLETELTKALTASGRQAEADAAQARADAVLQPLGCVYPY
jgi:class 3 adenylate cyclase